MNHIYKLREQFLGTHSVILLARGNKAGDYGAGGDSFWWRCIRLRSTMRVRPPATIIIAAEVALGCPHVCIPRLSIISLPSKNDVSLSALNLPVNTQYAYQHLTYKGRPNREVCT